MNRKGQVQVGAMIVLAVALIVGLVLITDGISEPIGTMTQKAAIVNESVALPAAGSTVQLSRGQAAESVVIVNATSGATVPTTNYTVQNRVVSNGALVTNLLSDGGLYAGQTVFVSYTYEPFGYDTNSGGRAIVNLILVFSALALVATAIVVVVKNGGIAFR